MRRMRQRIGLLHLVLSRNTFHRKARVRLDSGVAKGDEVSVYYDPMIANWWFGEWTEMIPFVVLYVFWKSFTLQGLQQHPFMKAVLKDDDFYPRITTGFLSEEKMNQLMPRLQVNEEETKITQDIAVLFTFAKDLQKQSSPAQVVVGEIRVCGSIVRDGSGVSSTIPKNLLNVFIHMYLF